MGRFNIPCDATSGNVNVRVYDPQGMLLWQRLFSQSDAGQGLYLNVMPSGNNDAQLHWDLLRGIEDHEIRYGKTAAMDQRINNHGATSGYYLSDLDAGEMYFFQVAALKDGREIMASEIVEMTIGATMRELEVYDYVDGNNVQLVWTEYPGADKYRVAWGMTSGALGASFELNELNYTVPGLITGNMYYMKVFALDGGGVISESREVFIHLQAFQSQGGDIYTIPDPPVQGQDLQINMHFYDDLPFIPEVVVHLQNADVPLAATGYGRDFMAILPAASFTAAIEAVDVFDPQGTHMIGRSMSGTSGGYGGTQVPIFITPDPPQIGADLNVRVEFPQPPGFMPALFVEFTTETRQYAFPQLADDRIFDMTIPGSAITSSIIKVRIEGPNGMFLGDRYFDGSGSGGHDHVFTVTPAALAIGSSVDMELDIGETVFQPPILRIYFDTGTQEVSMLGAIPGQFFTYNIASLTSMISSIDIVNPETFAVEHTWYPTTYNTTPSSCDIVLSNDPPVIGLALDVQVSFSDYLPFTPKLIIGFAGLGPTTYIFPQQPGLNFYSMGVPVGDMTVQVMWLEIRDEYDNLMCDYSPQQTGTSSVNITSLYVTPNPPQIGQDLQLHVEFNTPVGFTPRWRLFTISGPIEGDFSQGSGLSVYDQIIPGSLITLFPTDLEIIDENNNDLPGGELYFVDEGNFTCTASFDPFPPVPFTSLTVTAIYESGNFPSYVPRFSMEFDTAGGYSQDFPQAAGQSFYSMTIPGGVITDTVLQAGIGDPTTGSIDCGADFEEGIMHVTITVSPDPPTPGNDINVTATFDDPVPFVPQIFVEFDTAATIDYYFPQPAGAITYSRTIPGVDVIDIVKRMVIKTPQGETIADDLLFGTAGTFEIESLDAVGSDKIDIVWPYDDWVNEYRIHYGIAAGSYNGSNSPVIVTGTGFYQLGSAEALTSELTYYIKVEAYDNFNNLVFASPEDFIFLTVGTVEYPTGLSSISTGVSGEIKVFWDNVAGVDGYYVYYGETTQSYNTSGSPLDITDPSATQAVINGLTDSTLYYITVEAYIGATESNNPVEVSDFPGTGSGSLISAPALISTAANVGTNITQQNLSITNNGGTSANVKFELDPLDRDGGGGTIPPSNYTISPNSISIGAGSSGNFTVDLFIPGGATTGNYGGIIRFYDDENSNSFYDTGEGFTDVPVGIVVTGGGGSALTASPSNIFKAADAGTNTSSESVEITNNTGSGATIKFETTNLTKGSGPNIPPGNYTITPASVFIPNGSSGSINIIDLFIPGGQADGNYAGTIKFYADTNSNSFFDGGEDFVDVTYNVTIPAGGGGGLTASPTIIIKSIGQGTLKLQVVNITNNTGTAVDIRVEALTVLNRNGGGGIINLADFTISPDPVVNSVPDGSDGVFTVSLDIQAGQNIGTYDLNSITFYADTIQNGSFDSGTEASVVVPLDIDITAPPTFDHIHKQFDAFTSTMGSPIFATLTAHDVSHNKVVSYETLVTIGMQELSAGNIPGSWHISTNDGPQGPDTSTVEMFGGVGNFTVDALEPEIIGISVNSETSDPSGTTALVFEPNAGVSAAIAYAIIGPNRVPTSTSSGGIFWIAAVDSSGQVITDYAEDVVFNLSSIGDVATFVSNGAITKTHTYTAGDNGQFKVEVKSGTAQNGVTLEAVETPFVSITGGPFDANIDFVGVDRYLVFAGAGDSTTFTSQGMMINFTLRAADSSNNIVRSYNEAATFTRTVDLTNDAFLSDGSAIQFVDGIAEITLNNSQAPETVDFLVAENTNPSIDTISDITVDFQASDSTAPEIVRVEMDTPWIVHVYFNEDVDSVTAGEESNYTGVGSIDKVCWYGDNVTLNLASPGTLGGMFNLTIDLVEDTTGNPMSSVAFNNIPVPDVDFQGARGTINDWFEIQASNTNPAAGETIHITVYHKNICGYLSGSNSANADSSVGSITINYTGAGPRLDGSQTTSPSFSNGRADFDITIAASPTAGAVTISATGGSPTVNTTTILTLTIP